MTAFIAGQLVLAVAGVWAGTARPTTGARRAYQIMVLAGCVISMFDPARVLLTGSATSLSWSSALPGGDWQLGIDPLSAVFLITILGVGAACAVFGARDLERSGHPNRFASVAFVLLVSAIAFVVVARAIVTFLAAWEVMAIASYVLIVTDHDKPEVRRAGLIYLVATHTATLALFVLFALWSAHATAWSFDALAAATPALTSAESTGILLLALFAFGFKAGCVPLHFWLPPAHGAAPSHVSALMSGIVIKTGIYGLLRVLLLLDGAPAWWGWLVFGIGTTSALLGVLWALAQHDLKRLLAYHSVENIGIIFMGIGLGTIGVARGSMLIAFAGFAGALLHTTNHALFKSLLFLSAGAVYRATGTRDIDRLGGLAKRMPLTWMSFAVGAAAIIGVPPFNGFVSEWLVFQGMFHTADSRGAVGLAVLGIPVLALTGALALACFAKVAGIVFLGTSRSADISHASDIRGTLSPMFALATACLALGVVPTLGIRFVRPAVMTLAGPSSDVPATILSAAQAVSLVAIGIIGVTGLLALSRRALRGHAPVRQDVTWACGFPAGTPRMQYTASSFAAPLLAIFGRLSGVRAARGVLAFHTHPFDLVFDAGVRPVWRRVHRVALRLRATQQGRLHVYLLYVMGAVLGMLAYLALAPR